MTRKWNLRIFALAFLVAGLSAVVLQTTGDPGTMHCYFFEDNTEVYFPGYGTVCAGWGSGCHACWTECAAGQPCGGMVCGEIVGCTDQQPP